MMFDLFRNYLQRTLICNTLYNLFQYIKVIMCGIVSCLSYSKDKLQQYLINGLFQLRNRGFDSAGISMLGLNGIFCEKFASTDGNTHNSIDLLENMVNLNCVDNFTCGIGHTRWATMGCISKENSHPHVCDKIHVVHNGNIDNYVELKYELIQSKYVFKSDTDTEVISVLIARECDLYPSRPILVNFTNAIKYLQGTWAIVMIHEEYNNKLFVATHGSPLSIGFNSDTVWVASEKSAFCGLAVKSIHVPENTIIEITQQEASHMTDRDFVIVSELFDHKQLSLYTQSHLISDHFNNDLQILHESVQDVKIPPSPFCFWTQKEIYDQPESLNKAMNNGGRLKRVESAVYLGGLQMHRNELSKIDHLIMIGCGSSENAARYALKYFKQLKIFKTVQVFDASEFNFDDLPNYEHNTIGTIIISQSGETKDCQTCLEWLPKEIVTIGVINVVGSWLARQCMCGVYVNAGREIGVASTKSFSCQVFVLAQIALWFAKMHLIPIYTYVYELTKIPSLFSLHLTIFNQDIITRNANLFVNSSGPKFILGRGYGLPIAQESSLKLKELTYLSVEGYPGGSLKHGPLSLLSPDSLCFVIILKGEHQTRMISCLREIIARKSKVVVISNDCLSFQSDHKNIQSVIEIGSYNEFNAGLSSILFFQLLSVEAAVLLGNHPDFPRSLAKSVTVG